MQKLSAHPAMGWNILGKVVESIEIAPPDDVVIVFEDGAQLRLTEASVNAELVPYRDVMLRMGDTPPLDTEPARRANVKW